MIDLQFGLAPLFLLLIFLVVASIGGAGSIPGALAASLLLGAVDTVARYLAPEYGAFFFYLAVIAIVWIARPPFAAKTGAPAGGGH